MNELSEDRIARRIKEVLGHYEPDYSPQAWEKLRKLMPAKESRLKILLLKYKFWFSGLVITGILVIVYNVTNIRHADEVSAIDPVSSEYANYTVSEEPKEIAYSEKTATLRSSISEISIGQEGKSAFPEVTPVPITESLPATYQNNSQAGNAVTEIPESIERASLIPVSPERIEFDYQYNSTLLIPIEDRSADIKPSKDPSYDKTAKFEFHWPGFNSSLTNEGDYNKFVGPNKFAFFYSPEIHYSDSIGNMGVSQGMGITFEGRIRSLVSVSTGLSYQAINFDKTISSVKVPPHVVLQPPDTNRILYYVDSIEIRSGSYKFLELPVSVNYKFIESARSQVWLGTGISAIAFLGQEYTYETVVEEVSESSSVSVKAWEDIHPLASLNFSLLYRYNFNDRFILHGSIQYKQHLVPMGYNSMKLNRLNFQIGMIYRLGRRN
jgi:hypothetical protein